MECVTNLSGFCKPVSFAKKKTKLFCSVTYEILTPKYDEIRVFRPLVSGADPAMIKMEQYKSFE